MSLEVSGASANGKNDASVSSIPKKETLKMMKNPLMKGSKVTRLYTFTVYSYKTVQSETIY